MIENAIATEELLGDKETEEVRVRLLELRLESVDVRIKLAFDHYIGRVALCQGE